MNKSAPAAKKASAKLSVPAKAAKAKAPKKVVKKRAAKPRVASEKQLLVRQVAREEREQARAKERADRLREREEARLQRLADIAKRKKDREAKKIADRQARKEEKLAAKEARGRTKRDGLPTIKKDMVIEHTELLKPWSERPFTGRDLDVLSKRYGLNAAEFSAALGLQNRFQFTKLLRTSRVVPFDVEVLARLYESSPSPAPWRAYTADEVFKTLYGPLIDKFGSTPEDRAFAETHYSVRFTASLDRSSSTAYRWIDTDGGARMVIALLLRKVMSMPHPRETLERVSALVHKVRGGDFEKRAPVPVPGMQYGRRGRVPGATRSTSRESAMPLAVRPITL